MRHPLPLGRATPNAQRGTPTPGTPPPASSTPPAGPSSPQGGPGHPRPHHPTPNTPITRSPYQDAFGPGTASPIHPRRLHPGTPTPTPPPDDRARALRPRRDLAQTPGRSTRCCPWTPRPAAGAAPSHQREDGDGLAGRPSPAGGARRAAKAAPRRLPQDHDGHAHAEVRAAEQDLRGIQAIPLLVNTDDAAGEEGAAAALHARGSGGRGGSPRGWARLAGVGVPPTRGWVPGPNGPCTPTPGTPTPSTPTPTPGTPPRAPPPPPPPPPGAAGSLLRAHGVDSLLAFVHVGPGESALYGFPCPPGVRRRPEDGPAARALRGAAARAVLAEAQSRCRMASGWMRCTASIALERLYYAR